MINLHVTDEFSTLKAVVLGIADSNGPTPKLEDTYDPKSAEHIKAGTYPKERDMVQEMELVFQILSKYNVKVYRPEKISNYNQIFSRDIAFVIEDKMIISNILPDRNKEIDAIEHVWSQVDKNNLINLQIGRAHV